jgi:hypothetical protein
MIDPVEATSALMTKWIISALEPGESNFKSIICFRLWQFQPYTGGAWCLSAE